jgi:hypothetical protein
MTALKTVLAGGVAAVALVGAVPAAAQYYPQYGYGNGGNAVGQVLNQVLGGGQYGGYGGYGGNSQLAVNQCTAAVTQRINREYGNRYGGYGGYGGGYGYAQPAGELTFKCDVDYRGYISDIDLDRNNYGYRRY